MEHILSLKSGSTSSLFLYLFFMRTRAENVDSHKYVDANGIRCCIAFRETSGYKGRECNQNCNRAIVGNIIFKLESQDRSISCSSCSTDKSFSVSKKGFFIQFTFSL